MKNLTKTISICLFCVVLLSIGGIQKASAYTDINTSYQWTFGIDDVIGITHGGRSIEPKDGTFYLSNGSMAIITRYAAQDGGFTNCSIRLDDEFIGFSGDSKYFVNSQQTGNTYFVLFRLDNLTPGKHTIQLVQNKPWYFNTYHDPNYMGPAQKKCTIHVVVPGATDGNTTTSAAATYTE